MADETFIGGVPIRKVTGNDGPAGDEINVKGSELKIDSVAMTADAAELNYVAGVTAGTAAASKALVTDANSAVDILRTASLRLGTSGSETTVTATGTELNHLANADRLQKTVKVALAAVDTDAGVFAWQNTEESAAIIVTGVVVDVTTASSGACTINIGQAATATNSDNIIDGLDVNSAIGVFDHITEAGTNGKTAVKVADDEYITGGVATGASAGLVGNAYITYMVV